MLILTRREGESMVISLPDTDDTIEVRVMKAGAQVSLGIDAAREVQNSNRQIVRGEPQLGLAADSFRISAFVFLDGGDLPSPSLIQFGSMITKAFPLPGDLGLGLHKHPCASPNRGVSPAGVTNWSADPYPYGASPRYSRPMP